MLASAAEAFSAYVESMGPRHGLRSRGWQHTTSRGTDISDTPAHSLRRGALEHAAKVISRPPSVHESDAQPRCHLCNSRPSTPSRQRQTSAVEAAVQCAGVSPRSSAAFVQTSPTKQRSSEGSPSFVSSPDTPIFRCASQRTAGLRLLMSVGTADPCVDVIMLRTTGSTLRTLTHGACDDSCRSRAGLLDEKELLRKARALQIRLSPYLRR